MIKNRQQRENDYRQLLSGSHWLSEHNSMQKAKRESNMAFVALAIIIAFVCILLIP